MGLMSVMIQLWFQFPVFIKYSEVCLNRKYWLFLQFPYMHIPSLESLSIGIFRDRYLASLMKLIVVLSSSRTERLESKKINSCHSCKEYLIKVALYYIFVLTVITSDLKKTVATALSTKVKNQNM